MLGLSWALEDLPLPFLCIDFRLEVTYLYRDYNRETGKFSAERALEYLCTTKIEFLGVQVGTLSYDFECAVAIS